MSVATIRKALVTLVGVVLMVVTFVAHSAGGFLPATWVAVALGLEAALTTISTWLVPNEGQVVHTPVERA